MGSRGELSSTLSGLSSESFPDHSISIWANCHAIPSFYYSLTQYLKNDLIRLEKRAMWTIVMLLSCWTSNLWKALMKIYVTICFDLSKQIIRFLIYHLKYIIRVTFYETKTILIFLLLALKTHLSLQWAISLISYVEYASRKFQYRF